MPVTNVQEVDQFGNYLNTLFENITGEVYEPQSYQTLFPDVEQKQNAVSLDASFNTNNFVFNPNAIGQGLVSNGGIQQGMYFDNLQDKPLFNPVLSGPFNPQPAWGQTGSAPVIRRGMGVNPMQQHNPTDHPHQYVALPAVMTGNIKKEPLSAGAIKSEPQDSPTIKSEESRTYVHMSTQTKAKQEGVMMMQRPTERKSTKSYENLDPTALLESAPSVPDTPFPEISVKESTVVDQDKDQAKDAPKSPSEETPSSPSATRPATSGKYSDMLQRAKARQAEAAAAAAAKAAEPLDPVEAMTRQLAQTRLDDPKVKFITQPARTKPITEGDMERQMNAAKARALCENDPVRKQHAEVVLNLLQSIDNMMAGHRKKVAVWKAVQSREAGGEAAATAGVTTSPRHASSRGQFSVHNQDQIRTVTSILSSRPTSQTPPLHQDLSKLHSSLADHRPSSYSDMPVMYPNSSSDLQSSADEPFELTEEERRYIEEDNARIAAARETPGYQSVRV
ncbi:hypothetical protein B0O80DRAFT_446174 [Mortierella sp. GBAus27b]|nr:hypothetical protein B0O80DRAFT_446174 [Mortierella sp. GBAus27b]